MKGLILCAGRGTRLRPYTYARPKPLLPVANRPIILHAIAKLAEAGITDIGIVVSPNALTQFHDTIGTRYESVHITYVQQNEPLGLANALAAAEQFIGNEPVCVWLGDNYYADSLDGFVKAFRSEQLDASLVVSKVSNPQQFGVAVLDGRRVASVIEKPRQFISPYALVGIYLFTPKILDAISRLHPSARGEFELTDAIQRMIENGNRVSATITDAWWRDTGNPGDFLLCNRYVVGNIGNRDTGADVRISNSSVRNAVVIGANTQIVDSTIQGPVMIGSDCNIVGSFIGPFTSIGSHTELVDSEIENSVVLERTSILNVKTRIDMSIIGGNTVLQGIEKHPQTLQMYLGDNSKLHL